MTFHTRHLPTALAVVAVLAFACAPAQARKKKPDADAPAHAETKKDGGAGKPTQVATFGDWGAFLAKAGRSRTCYALASPKERKPEIKREAAYIFISDRPGEKVHNEVSIIMGFPVKDTGTPQAKIGRATFDLVAKGANAWIKNPDEEAKFVEAMQHAGSLVVKAAAAKGPATADSYALDGFKQALARVTKDCK